MLQASLEYAREYQIHKIRARDDELTPKDYYLLFGTPDFPLD